jgi:hypothetical protein
MVVLELILCFVLLLSLSFAESIGVYKDLTQ